MPHSAQLHWDYRDGKVAAVTAAIVYSLWVVEVLLPGGDTVQGALSDPGADFARFLDSAHRIAAVLVMIAAGLGLGLGAREQHSHLLSVSWWSMGVFGLTSLVATVFPGPCAVSTDLTCTAESMVEALPGATLAQTVIALIAILAALVSVVVLAVDRYRMKERAWWLVAVVAVLQLASTIAVLVMAGLVYAASGDGEAGVELNSLQRAHLTTVALWLLAAGLLPGPWQRPRKPRPVRTAR
ncbi:MULTISPECIES: DUF998 domain-containing protein [Nocardiopsis]|uniref:DUF998 domain-containing protein n=1 Tax=Nocardiopsis sinuspersici TaxID=501010 RepID=A0A1V3C4F0_9ACTN|nr:MULTISPECIES: DUF998 domain-containing protein [Nocardiopsis]OOC55661.1 DUF998 domain-containing protein [Nocardiopsis sinuspersici]